MELELYQETWNFKLSRGALFLTISVLTALLPFANEFGPEFKAYLLPIVIFGGVATFFIIATNRYRYIGKASCSNDSITTTLLDGTKNTISIANVFKGKVSVVSYRGRNAGLTGLVATGEENLIWLKDINGDMRFKYYIHDANERRRCQMFFDGWHKLNPRIIVAY